MEKNKSKISVVATAFILVELTLGALIQLTGGALCSALCFSSVVISLLFSAFLLLFDRSASHALTTTALLFTVISDLFLVVISPAVRLPAMFSFSLAQICYFLRIYLGTDSKKERAVHLSVRGCAILVFIIACSLVLGGKTDFLSIISVFYFANLLTNFIFASWQYKISILFPIGLLFFMMCDIVVGLSVMSELYIEFSEGSLLYNITHTELDLVWLFYVPSQTLIPISLLKKQGEV